MKNILSIITHKYILIIISLILFTLGNIVYSPALNFSWYISSILSELMFVLMYTIIDFGNLKYKYKFAIPHIGFLLLFYLPIFTPLFYNVNAQLFSISIAILAILVNGKVLHLLHNKGLEKILCSRTSTILASLVDILLFSFILNLGLKGALLMSILRAIYVIIIPKFIFNHRFYQTI